MLRKMFMVVTMLVVTFSFGSFVNASGRGGRMQFRSSAIVGNNVIKTESVKLNPVPYQLNIKQLSLLSAPDVKVIIRPGEEPLVSVTTDENIFETLKIDINEEKKEINIGGPERYTPTQFIVEVTVPLRGFAGNGRFDFDAIIGDVPGFVLNEDGGISGILRINGVPNVKVEVDGKASIELAGRTNVFELEIDGTGNVNAVGLETHICSVKGDGKGELSVSVDTDLNIKLEGNWKCTYSGRPTNIRKKTEGICVIRQIG